MADIFSVWGLAAVVAAYLIGSLSFAVIVSKFYGLDDPRSYGSGNPGATNVLRSGRKKAAALTLLGDALKGLVAVLLARWLQSYFGLADEVVAAVATALGVLLALSWPVALICAAVWLMMAFGLKISSLAALTATVISPLAAMFLVQQPSWQAAIAVIAALVLLRHRSNIQNLLSGKESKIGSGK